MMVQAATRAIFSATVFAKKMPQSMASKASPSQSSAANESFSIPASIRSRPDSNVSISVHAKPASKMWEKRVEVQIDAPARDGEANEALLGFMAKVLGVRKRDVSLGTGARSREKVIIVQGMSAQNVYNALKAKAVK